MSCRVIREIFESDLRLKFTLLHSVRTSATSLVINGENHNRYVHGSTGSTASDLRQLFSENAQIAQIKGRRLRPTRVKIADRHTEDELFVGHGGPRRLTLLPLKRRDRNIPHSLPSCTET